MNKFQAALDHVSKVTMTMPINDQIITLQECVDQLEKYKNALNKICLYYGNDQDCSCPVDYKKCNGGKCPECLKKWSLEE